MREKTPSSEASEWRDTHWLRRLVLRWLFPWGESKLITADKQIYTVRSAPMREREIRNPWSGRWTPESEVRFSRLECFEDYHSDAYFAAEPFEENVQGDSQSPDK